MKSHGKENALKLKKYKFTNLCNKVLMEYLQNSIFYCEFVINYTLMEFVSFEREHINEVREIEREKRET
jgi:hypothetical protein